MEGIYMDHAATTLLRPEVADEMEPYLRGLVGNPSSVHRWGRAARRAVEDARDRIADRLHVPAEAVRFTRGGTESVNLAVLGLAGWLTARESQGPLFLRSALEHAAVRESMESLEAFGVRIEVIRVSPSGTVDLPEARELSRRRIRLVSCQWVNQESGMVLPIPEIARECEEAGVPLHVDAVQACGRIAFGPLGRAISLMSLSGHKLGGPPGTGVLVVREGTELRPTLHGGGQERGLRPGTEDVAGAVGFARALEVCLDRMPEESLRIADLRDRLEGGLLAALPETRVSAKDASRAPHVLGLGIPGLPRDVLPGALDLEGIGASAGSACASGSTDVSPTFRALHGQEAARLAPLRLSLGWTSTPGEVEEAIRTIPRVVERVRDTFGSEARSGKDRKDSTAPMGETVGRPGRQPR